MKLKDILDFDRMAIDSKSHTAIELKNAIEGGRELWLLDSGTSGLDDLLIYEAGSLQENIESDLIDFFELDNSPFDARTNPWTLEKLSKRDLIERYRKS